MNPHMRRPEPPPLIGDDTYHRIKDRVEGALPFSANIETFDRVEVRREVARALAAEGIVLSPQAWAKTVRDLVDELQAPQLRAIVTEAASRSAVLFEALLEGLHDAAIVHEGKERERGS